MVYEKIEENMKNAETEKDKTSMESKLNTIRCKVAELKRQSEIIKAQIEAKNNNHNSNENTLLVNIIVKIYQIYLKYNQLKLSNLQIFQKVMDN